MSFTLADRFFTIEPPRKPVLNVGVGNSEEQRASRICSYLVSLKVLL